MTGKQYDALMLAIRKQTIVQIEGFKICAELLGAMQANLEYQHPCSSIPDKGRLDAATKFVQALSAEMEALPPQGDK